jgi:CRISPR-associated protein Cas6
MGDRLPSDHNYRLYSALVEKIPSLKEMDWQLGTITGIPDHEGNIKLGRKSILMARCKISDINLFGVLDNQYLRIGQSILQLGSMEGSSLRPATKLHSRIVTISTRYRGRIDPFEFGVALGRKMSGQGFEVIPMPELGKRLTLKIRENTVIGYGLTFDNLAPNESLKLLLDGVGGRRKMGCGVFVQID